MILYVNKRQDDWHVEVRFSKSYLKRYKHMAQFKSRKMGKRKCFGTIYLANANEISVAAHEIVHASIHFFITYSDLGKLKKMSKEQFDDYFHESLARCVENMLREYIIYVRKNNMKPREA